MSLEKYLSEIQIPCYKICMQYAKSTSEGIIISCLLQQMNINCETKGVIVSDIIITKNLVNKNDLWKFQANPPSYIKTIQINPNLWLYKIDIEFLSSEFKRIQL